MLNVENPAVKSDWHSIAFNDTRYWNFAEEDKPFIEKMLSVYFFDRNEVTYCCELTPSYFLRGLYNAAVCRDDTPDEVRDRINERYEVGVACEDTYMHCSAVSKMESKPFGQVDDDTTEDDVREHLQGNCPY